VRVSRFLFVVCSVLILAVVPASAALAASYSQVNVGNPQQPFPTNKSAEASVAID
jgi:hypothetical protein